MEKQRTKITIIDMQPISPAIGGGRQRLLGLYHALGEDIDAVYVGSYDWPGEKYRDQQLTKGLREVLVPLSDAHHKLAEDWRRRMDGRVVIDCMFGEHVTLSPAFLDVAGSHIKEADIVVFSHPWAYLPLKHTLRDEQLLVYDSHNVEAILRTEIFGDNGSAREVLKRVIQSEYMICREADLILACSHEDRLLFWRLYDVELAKVKVVPNGIFAFDANPASDDERSTLKMKLGCGQVPLAVFLGSNYGPNNDAARFIALTVARHNPEVRFALMGGCCESLDGVEVPSNVHLQGTVDETTKLDWLRAADLAINPLGSGSGTSIKMFDFLARGLPTLTTAVGARGIVQAGEKPFIVASLGEIPVVVGQLLANRSMRKRLADAGRKLVEEIYAWERISPELGVLLLNSLSSKAKGRPFFSVVIPTYERPDHLYRLLQRLANQSRTDFEVIVVDQSEARWAHVNDAWPFRLTYWWTPVKGAVKARNSGGRLATGHVIAFTDDDCEPRENWLANAFHYFSRSGVVGVEGLVVSDHLGDPEWRPVSNVGFEGIGFMTANLFVRNDCFQRLDGFDLAFDNPHFREDTDFGWRLQELGEVPFAGDVEIFHPPHRREILRESEVERSKFFEKDALLIKKHPNKYEQLFLTECHWKNSPGFWPNFERGLKMYSVHCPEWIARFRPR